MNAPVLHANPAPSEDGQLQYLPVAAIAPQPGFNPRTFFEDAAYRALVDSVCLQGIIQPIVVRPAESPGLEAGSACQYWIVAGERRWRAARECALEEIPAVIRLVDERAALALADIENSQRDDLSPAEEAQTARRMIDYCDGDRAEAARLLGWTPAKLEARLLLLHARPEVLKALAERRIKLGHAELLCGLAAESQPGTLASILEKQISVADLKARIAAFALDLATAIFDKAECLTCPHNSNTQASLFTETIGEGRCQNRACFAQKTQAALAARRDALAGEYPVVWLDTDKPPSAYTALQEHGPQGVGPAQFHACKGCRHYGALLETAPGREGQVVPGLCFDLACNRQMVSAFQGQSAAQTPAAPPAAPGRAKLPPGPTAAQAAAPAAPPKKVEEAVDGFYRQTAARIAAANPEVAHALLLFAILKDGDFPNALLDRYHLPLSRRREDLVKALYALAVPAKQALLAEAVEYLLASHSTGFDNKEIVGTAQAVVAMTQCDLAGRFMLDEAFLKAHTKAGIEALMNEAVNPDGQRFAQWYNAARKDKAAFKKLMGKKMEEIIKTILDSGFDFIRFVPAAVSRRLTRTGQTPATDPAHTDAGRLASPQTRERL